jgi:hypothetical protein
LPIGGAESGALSVKSSQMDASLTTVLEAWPRLSAKLRERILAMVTTDE